MNHIYTNKPNIVALVLLFSLISYSALAQQSNDNFDTDSSEIINKLKQQAKPKVRLRSFPSATEDNLVNTRALKRITSTNEGNDTIKSEIVNINNIDVNNRVKLSVTFNKNSSKIKYDSVSGLDALAEAIQDESLKSLRILVSGHTDSDGTEEGNLKLSFERAKSVKFFLVNKKHIPESRIDIAGYGEGDPIAGNILEVDKQLNRRVEISIQKSTF
jgi:outer membrane protein OmpA-like peptidoglycan-associated protein